MGKQIDTKIYYHEIRYKYRSSREVAYQTSIYGFEVETEHILLTRNGLLTLKVSYAWDGASGPAIDTNTNMRPSAIHDALIQLYRLELLPQTLRMKMQIDTEYYHACRQDGMFLPRAIWEFAAVQWKQWQSTKTSEEKTAP